MLQRPEVPLEKRRDREAERRGLPGEIQVDGAILERVLSPDISLAQMAEQGGFRLAGDLDVRLIVEPVHLALVVGSGSRGRDPKDESPLPAHHHVGPAVGKPLRASKPGRATHRARLGKLGRLTGRQKAEQPPLGRETGEVGQKLTIAGLEDVEREEGVGEEDEA